MPDENKPVTSPQPPPVLPVIPPMAHDASISPPPPVVEKKDNQGVDIPPVVTTSSKKGGKKSGRIIATILGLFVLVGGIAAGVILVQQQQDIREKAAEMCDGWAEDGSVHCNTSECRQYTCNNGTWDGPQGVGVCSEQSVCDDDDGDGDDSVCGGRTCPANDTDCGGDNQGCCVTENCEYYCDSGIDRSGANCENEGNCDCDAPSGGDGDECGVWCDVHECPSGCTLRHDCCANGTHDGCASGDPETTTCALPECRVANPTRVLCSEATASGCGQVDLLDENRGYCGVKPGTQCTNGTNACESEEPPPSGEDTASCDSCTVYDEDWEEIDLTDISVGQTVYFATLGSSTPADLITKAGFKINTNENVEEWCTGSGLTVNAGFWCETTNKHDTYGYYVQYTIPSAGSYDIESSVYAGETLGWIPQTPPIRR